MSATTIPSLEAVDVAWRTNPSKLSVVKAVGRRMVPYLIEATIIPTALFYLFLITFELKWAIVAALGWTYAAIARRLVTRSPISGLLVLATLGIVRRADRHCTPGWSLPVGSPTTSYSSSTSKTSPRCAAPSPCSSHGAR